VLTDDLPVIKENIRKGFLETQSRVNQWVTQLKKKLDGEDDENDTRPPDRPKQDGQRRSGDSMRRSTDRDRERYDADPRVLSDDFAGLDISHDEGSSLSFCDTHSRYRKHVVLD
jgi:hypothetical protein